MSHDAKNAALAYLRVSSKGQVDGDGFERQRTAISEAAAALELELVGEYRDEGVSGTLPVQERPGFAELVDRIASNGVRVVLVEKADRLARDLIESELGLRIMRELGVRVIEAEGGNDLTEGDGNPTAVLIRQVLGAVAEFEKSALVSKLRAARKRVKARTGRCEGIKAYGALEGEQEALKALRRLRRKNPKTGKRRTYAEVAAELELEGHSTRSGKPWTASKVRELVRSGERNASRRAAREAASASS